MAGDFPHRASPMEVHAMLCGRVRPTDSPRPFVVFFACAAGRRAEQIGGADGVGEGERRARSTHDHESRPRLA